MTPTAKANAGVIDYVKSLFVVEAQQKEVLYDANSQTALLLKPVSSVVSSVDSPTIVDDSVLMSDSGPAGTIADIQDIAPKISTHIVKEGDYLGKIANIYGVSVNTIMWANDISNEKSLKIGQTLIILPITGVTHKVKAGDTIQSIAKKYGGDVSEILRYNNMDEKDKLAIGDSIIIPDGEIKTNTPSSGGSTPSRSIARLPSFDSYYIKPAINVRKTQGIHGHNGIDLAPLSRSSGTEPILAAAAGEVIVARYTGWNGGYGKMVIIAHPNGTQTVYAHCFAVLVNEGQIVEQGQVIGSIGNTGKSTGPHLHFEIRGAKNPF